VTAGPLLASDPLLTALRSGGLEAGEDLGRRLLESVTAEQLEAVLVEDLKLAPTILRSLGLALTASDPMLTAAARAYLPEIARSHGRRLAARGGPWSAADIDLLLTLQLVDPLRFVEEPAFRHEVSPLLAQDLDPAVPADLRTELLVELNRVHGVDFALSDEVESAWRAVPRRAVERRIDFGAETLSVPDPLHEPIAASVFSLSSVYFTADEAAALLTALRALAPDRQLLVLADPPLRRQLEPRLAAQEIDWLDTYGRPYSPWPRDPFTFARNEAGAVRLLVRPNRQPGREEDAYLGAEIVQSLSPALDREWGSVRWTEAPVPFHNGQLLPAAETLWISVHSVEGRILEFLGLDRVPVASFAREAGVRSYFAAARRAADELSTLYGRRVRFVHPLPEIDGQSAGASGDTETETPAEAAQLIDRLAGGAGIDLDSLVALLPGTAPGSAQALVADAESGAELLAALTPDEWRDLGLAYRLEPAADDLAGAVRGHHRSARVQRLQKFLDLVAEHLSAQGMEVHRLPLVAIPTALMIDRDEIRHADFLVTWTNVVVDTTADGPQAEGFSSLLPQADAEAEAVFEQAGYPLHLLPPLVRSVQLLGGYRCASNHLRNRRGIIQKQ